MKALKTKKQFINVQPKSSKAKNRFVNQMDSLHAMEVEQENDTQLFVVSINRRYCFWIPKNGNEHWDIIKQFYIGTVMFFLPILLASHVPQDLYLRCGDYEWLKERALSSEILSVSDKINFITHWMNHTNPECFEDKQ